MESQIPLAKVLDQVATELLAADSAAKERGQPVMQFDECEVEFAVAAEYTNEAGVKVWVVNLGVDSKQTETNKIRIKFKSTPGGGLQAAHLGADEGPELERQTQSSGD